jgi:putative CocE/NonD family hydrolase
LRIVTEFPRPIRTIENVWIPMPDGAQLAARLWLPEDAEADPVPAILEYLPYRKRDLMRARDEPMQSYTAGHGYAVVRVDVRGSGDSDGVLTDEYSVNEHRDALSVIEWIAAQPWCSGAVGMTGISWGGFNALQVAALRPPALKAIITLCASDDRYSDDAHYMGGCLLNENGVWGTVLTAYHVYPPDPDVVGDRWRQMWQERLESATLFPEHWMRHPTRDAYWQHGSVCEDFGAIECPVYAIGGWADGYSNAVPRLLAGLPGPRKGLVGPWPHAFPHDAAPGPSIGYLQEALRWWDHWLKDAETGIMDEPLYRVWMQDSVAPRVGYEERPGRWVAEAAWPSPRIETRRLHLNGTLPNAGHLDPTPEPGSPIVISSPPTTGFSAGEWCAFGGDGELPGDQRPDDGRSIIFDSGPLEERLEILGAPTLDLELSVDRPVAQIAVRLNDVAPDGTSLRVTYGLLNLTHKDGHGRPKRLKPGERFKARLALNDIAHAFPPGHSLRIAISTGYWPIAWPAPEPVTLTVHGGASYVDIPVRPPDPAVDDALAPFAEPEQGPGIDHTQLHPSPFRRSVSRDLAADEVVYEMHNDMGELSGAALAHIAEIDLDLGYTFLKRFRIGESDPLSARAETVQKTLFRRGDWSIRVDTRFRLSATKNDFNVHASLEAHEGDVEVFRRDWDVLIPRKFS